MSHLTQYLMVIGGFVVVAALAARLKVLRLKNQVYERLTHRHQLPERMLVGLVMVLVAVVVKGAYWLPMQLALATLVAYTVSASYYHHTIIKDTWLRDRHKSFQASQRRRHRISHRRTRARLRR